LAVEIGVTLVQLREKTCSSRELYEIGRRLHEVTRRLGVPLIVNDRVDVMRALDAEGVHVGQDDLPLPRIRELARGKIVGCSAHTPEEIALAAEQKEKALAALEPFRNDPNARPLRGFPLFVHSRIPEPLR
jgi:thiamine-phosphate diphosphorylase